MGYPDSYYAATAKSAQTYSELTETIDAETCIVGAGYAGLSTALGLVERDQPGVVVLDAEDIGFGCSGRNGGFAFGGYSLHEHGLLKAVGTEKARKLYGYTLDGIELIRQRIKDYGIDCDVNWSGVKLCNWFRDEQVLRDHQEFMADSFGVALEYETPEQLRENVKSDRYNGGLIEKNAFHFHPLKYALGLASVIAEKGGQLFANSRVMQIEADGPIKIVRTGRGQVCAKRLVICCGGYLNGLYKPLQRASLPIGTYVMVTENLGDRRGEAFTCEHAIYDTRFAFDYYRPLPDGRIMWGGRLATNTKQPGNLDELLCADLLKVFPQLEGVKVDYAWQGLMSWSRHKMPQIGQEKPNVWYAQAFGGHGVAPTNISGEFLAAAIADGDTRYREFADRFRLSSVFGPLGKIGAELTYQWYMHKDRRLEG